MDKQLICTDCAASFVFSDSEQQFFFLKGLHNEPRRCPNCRVVLRMRRRGDDETKLTTVDCAECGLPTTVPFKPTGSRPVYCGLCLHSKKEAAIAQ